MGVVLEVAGEDITSYVDFRNIEVVDGAESRGDTLNFTAHIPYSDLGSSVDKPRPGNVAVLTVDGSKLFEGPVISSDDRFFNSQVMAIDVQCSDYTFFLDRKHIAKVEMGVQNAGDRIESLLQEFAAEFTDYASWDSGIATGLPLPKEGYDYEQFSSVMDRVCEAIGYSWHVGFDASVEGRPKMFFYISTNATSPLNTDYSNILDLDSNIEIGGVTTREDISNLHNVVIVKDFSEKNDDEYSQEYVADGHQTFFKLPMEPFDLEDTSVSVQPGGTGDFIPRTVALDPLTAEDEEVAGIEGYAYLCILNWGVRFPTTDYPSEGDVVKVDYNYVVPDRIIPLYDKDSIDEMARRQGNDGHHEVVVSLPDYRVDSSEGYNAAEFYGYMLLERHAWPEISGSFTVMEPSTVTDMEGWEAGQYFDVESDVRDIYDIQHWVETGRGEKEPVRVWITRVTRHIKQITDADGTLFETKVDFSTVLRR